MAYKLKDLDSVSAFNFSKEMDAILKFLKEHWDIKAAPKGYKTYMERYDASIGADIEKLDEQKVLDSFEGHGDGGTCSHPFALNVMMPYVAYNDRDQGRDPINTLLSAVLGHGMLIGMRLAFLDPMSHTNLRVSMIRYAYDMFQLENDEQIKRTYADEIQELFNVAITNHPNDTHEKYQKIRKNILIGMVKNFVEDFDFLKKGEVTLTRTNKGLSVYWRAFLNLHMMLSEEKFNELMAGLGLSVTHNGRVSYTVSKMKTMKTRGRRKVNTEE